MKQLVINCYTWEELSQEQKKKVCDNNRDIELDWLTTEDIVWDLSNAGQSIADRGFLNPEVYFNYSNSQGDGACFDCSLFNWDLLLEDLDIPHKSLFIKILKKENALEPRIKRPAAFFTHHYYHESCRRFSLHYAYYKEPTKFPKKYTMIIEQIEKHVESKRREACLKAFDEIRDTINYAQSDEHLEEIFSSQDYYYREDTLQIVDESRLIEIKEEKA